MIIKSISLNNYRLYKGVNIISFLPKENKNIYLISGENGFGKTTFLHSLMWCLYGRLITEIEADVRKDIAVNGYNAFLKSNLNSSVQEELNNLDVEQKDFIKRKGYTHENENLKKFTQYSVAIDFGEVIIPSLPCTSLQVIRGYDMIQEKEFVEILIDGVSNELAKEIGSEVFINDFILNKDIARFFFFDSERIVSLAETSTSSEKRSLCSAYNEVLGVRKYEDLKKNLENIRIRLRRKSSDTEGREKLLALLKTQESLKQNIANQRNSILVLENELAQLKAKDEALQLQLMREGNNATTNEIKRLTTLVEITKAKDEEYKRKLRVFLEYAPFAIVGELFRETKNQLEEDCKKRDFKNNKLSQNLIVQEINSELFAMLENIPLSENISFQLKREIQEIMSKYKQDITQDSSVTQIVMTEDDYEEFMSVYNNVTTTYRVEFEHLAEDYKKNKQILERNSRSLSNIKSKENDEVIKNLRESKNIIETNIKSKEIAVRSSYEEVGKLNQESAIISKRITELSKKVSLNDSDTKKDLLVEQLIKELAAFLESLKQEKKYSLERRIKMILNSLMHKEDFIGRVNVVVDGEDMDIELYATENKIITKDSLSKGEQQLYATSILKALVEESGIQFPVFIDSPLQKFDKSHAIKIITEFYPQISKQVVLFPLLHKELTSAEYDIMKPLVNATYFIKNDVTHSYFEEVQVENFLNE